jgi:hypothetical protein
LKLNKIKGFKMSTFTQRFSESFDEGARKQDLTATNVFVGTVVLTCAFIAVAIGIKNGVKSIKRCIEIKNACKPKEEKEL